MKTQTCAVIGDEDELEAIGLSSDPSEEWTAMELSGVDTAKIVTLHCVLTGEPFGDVMQAYEPVYVGPDEDTLVLRIPAAVVERLARLEEDGLEQVATELAATVEFEQDWDADAVQDLVNDLAELAQRAESDVLAMFVWMHAVPD
jgi:hypothetical protein